MALRQASRPPAKQQVRPATRRFSRDIPHGFLAGVSSLAPSAAAAASRYKTTPSSSSYSHSSSSQATSSSASYSGSSSAGTAVAAASTAAAAAPATSSAANGLLATYGWEEVQTAEGQLYYFHKVTRMSRWDRPDMAGEQSPSLFPPRHVTLNFPGSDGGRGGATARVAAAGGRSGAEEATGESGGEEADGTDKHGAATRLLHIIIILFTPPHHHYPLHRTSLPPQDAKVATSEQMQSDIKIKITQWRSQPVRQASPPAFLSPNPPLNAPLTAEQSRQVNRGATEHARPNPAGVRSQGLLVARATHSRGAALGR